MLPWFPLFYAHATVIINNQYLTPRVGSCYCVQWVVACRSGVYVYGPYRGKLNSVLSIDTIHIGSRVSSGSIVSDYGLDDRAIGVRSPAGADDFSSSLCVQTGSGAHPASCTVGTGGPFPGGKARPGRDADHSPPI
jgi:hypothetical protein